MKTFKTYNFNKKLSIDFLKEIFRNLSEMKNFIMTLFFKNINPYYFKIAFIPASQHSYLN